MNALLDVALGECDDLGATLGIVNGSLSLRPGDAPVPESLRERLRDHRDELTALLTEHPRPDPDPILFVARNLDVFRCPFALARTAPAVWLAARPYYRLTPRVWVWLAYEIDLAAGQRPDSPADVSLYQKAADLVYQFSFYIRDHFRPDQVRRACRQVRDLPEVRPPNLPAGMSCPKYSTAPTPAAPAAEREPCHVSPRRSDSAHKPIAPARQKAGRPQPGGATTPTGAGSAPLF